MATAESIITAKKASIIGLGRLGALRLPPTHIAPISWTLKNIISHFTPSVTA